MTLSFVIQAISFLAVGAVVGSLYFLLLFQTVRMHVSNAGFRVIAPLYLVRMAGAGAAFWAIAQQGAVELLLALLGFLAARYVFQRRATGS